VVNQVHVFCVECGHQWAELEEVVVVAYWDDRAVYKFECPSCLEFRTNPASSEKVAALLFAGVDLVVEPICMPLFEAAVVSWEWEMRR
jgi:hypothetical protein